MGDANTPGALRFRQATPAPLPFTELHRLELRNAFGLALFRKHIAAATAEAAWTNVEADLQAGVLVFSAVLWPDVFREAVEETASRRSAGNHQATAPLRPSHSAVATKAVSHRE